MAAAGSKRHIVRAVRRRRAVVVSICCAALVAASVVSLCLPRRFVGEAHLEVTAKGGVDGAEFSRRLEEGAQQLAARKTLDDVVAGLGLDAAVKQAPAEEREHRTEALYESVRAGIRVDAG